MVLSILAGIGLLDYQDNTKLFLIGGLAVTFGLQNATAREFGIQELSTTVLTATIVAIGVESRLAGGSGQSELLRYSIVGTMCVGALTAPPHKCGGFRSSGCLAQLRRVGSYTVYAAGVQPCPV